MKHKITFTVFIIIASVFSSFAQEVALTGGMNISNMLAKSDNSRDALKPRVGGHIGALFGFNLGEKISLQTGLLLSTKGFRYTFDEYEKVKLTYIEVPLLASYNYEINDDFKVYGGIGPVLGIAIGGKEVLDNEIYKISFGSNGYYKRLDVGLMIQAGAQYDKYRFGLFFNHGLLNIYNSRYGGSYREKNKVFGISAAYVIDLKK